MSDRTDHDDGDELAAVYRREVGRCTATLIRILGDIDLAEDAVAEAFAIAAERWPVTGIPPNPGGVDHDHRPQPGDRPAAPGGDPHRPPSRRPPARTTRGMHDDPDDLARTNPTSSHELDDSSTSSPTTSSG